MKYLLTILVFQLSSLIVIGQNYSPIRDIVNKHHENGFNGNVIHAKNDTIVYSGNFGVNNYETNHPLNDSSIFELGSNAKQFTAVAIIQLLEKGIINYDTQIEEIIIGFPYQGITIEHLLRHQSGLPGFMKLMSKKRVWNRDSIADNYDVLDALIKFQPKLRFDPGTKYKYSNTGYVILALIIEKTSGMTYPEYLKKHIFKPAGMNHSAVIRRRYHPVNIENNTEGYSFNKRTKSYEIRNKNPKYSCTYLDGVMGDGAISSTSLDMLKWNFAIKNQTLISSESTKKLFSADKVSKEYGCGFFIDDGDDERNIYHGGSWSGYLTWTYYLPESNEYIVILCNNNYSKTLGILNQILDSL